jgi:hypothetical protein
MTRLKISIHALRVETESRRAFSWDPISTLSFGGGANFGCIHPLWYLNISGLESLARLSYCGRWCAVVDQTLRAVTRGGTRLHTLRVPKQHLRLPCQLPFRQ